MKKWKYCWWSDMRTISHTNLKINIFISIDNILGMTVEEINKYSFSSFFLSYSIADNPLNKKFTQLISTLIKCSTITIWSESIRSLYMLNIWCEEDLHQNKKRRESMFFLKTKNTYLFSRSEIKTTRTIRYTLSKTHRERNVKARWGSCIACITHVETQFHLNEDWDGAYAQSKYRRKWHILKTLF